MYLDWSMFTRLLCNVTHPLMIITKITRSNSVTGANQGYRVQWTPVHGDTICISSESRRYTRVPVARPRYPFHCHPSPAGRALRSTAALGATEQRELRTDRQVGAFPRSPARAWHARTMRGPAGEIFSVIDTSSSRPERLQWDCATRGEAQSQSSRALFTRIFQRRNLVDRTKPVAQRLCHKR